MCRHVARRMFLGAREKLGGHLFFNYSDDYMVCNTNYTLLFGFCYCRVKKTRVCLPFISVKTFNDMPYIHFACNMSVSTQGSNLWYSTYIRFLLIIAMACMEKKKNIKLTDSNALLVWCEKHISGVPVN